MDSQGHIDTRYDQKYSKSRVATKHGFWGF